MIHRRGCLVHVIQIGLMMFDIKCLTKWQIQRSTLILSHSGVVSRKSLRRSPSLFCCSRSPCPAYFHSRLCTWVRAHAHAMYRTTTILSTTNFCDTDIKFQQNRNTTVISQYHPALHMSMTQLKKSWNFQNRTLFNQVYILTIYRCGKSPTVFTPAVLSLQVYSCTIKVFLPHFYLETLLTWEKYQALSACTTSMLTF